MSSENPFDEVIFSYSRQQAIDDGVLVSLSYIETIRQHWKAPMACTSCVWAIIEQALQVEGQDLNGIAHDISTCAKRAINTSRDTDQIYFSTIIAGRKHALKLHIGPGDTVAPVLTLMLPNED